MRAALLAAGISIVFIGPMAIPQAANERWSMDCVHDALHDGRRIRLLNVVDDCTRESLAIEVDTSLPGTQVIEVLERLADLRGLPRSIVADNGPEFAGRALACGRTVAGSRSTSSGPASRWTMRSSRASTDGSGTSA